MVGYYAKLCKVSSTQKCANINPSLGGNARKRLCRILSIVILHVDLPEDEESDEFKRINELKEKRAKEKISNGDFNFDGAKLYMIHFTSKVERHLSFNGAVIREDALFNGLVEQHE